MRPGRRPFHRRGLVPPSQAPGATETVVEAEEDPSPTVAANEAEATSRVIPRRPAKAKAKTRGKKPQKG